MKFEIKYASNSCDEELIIIDIFRHINRYLVAKLAKEPNFNGKKYSMTIHAGKNATIFIKYYHVKETIRVCIVNGKVVLHPASSRNLGQHEYNICDPNLYIEIGKLILKLIGFNQPIEENNFNNVKKT